MTLMTTPSERLSQARLKWVNSQLKIHFQETLAHPELLAGDGSTRTFFRVRTATHSAVVVIDPSWDQTHDYSAHQAFLSGLGIAVPEFLAEDASLGVLLMEDLGDIYLQSAILNDANQRLSLFQNAVDVLVDLHGKTFPVPKSLPVATRSFDAKKFMEEMRFTESHLLEGLLGIGAWTTREVGLVDSLSRKISELGPPVFCHRDYHTRNILYSEGRLVLIDFQDARLGCPHYDLASLLYDPYVPVTADERRVLLRRYQDQLQTYTVSKLLKWEKFDNDLELIALQRLIKAAGSFASFFTRFGKKSHLSYIKPALQTAQGLSFPPVAGFSFPFDRWLSALESAKLTS